LRFRSWTTCAMRAANKQRWHMVFHTRTTASTPRTETCCVRLPVHIVSTCSCGKLHNNRGRCGEAVDLILGLQCGSTMLPLGAMVRAHDDCMVHYQCFRALASSGFAYELVRVVRPLSQLPIRSSA
jgi:hypothetical protein